MRIRRPSHPREVRARPAPHAEVVALEAESEALAALVAGTAHPLSVVAEPEVRRIVAAATPARPYGRPAPRTGPPGPFRTAVEAAAGVAVVVGLLTTARHAAGVLVLLLVALFLAVSLDPAVRALERRGLRRPAAVALVAVLLLAAVAAFVAAAVPAVAHEAAELSRQAPAQVRGLRARPGPIGRLARSYHPPTGSDAARVLAGGALDLGIKVLSAVTRLVTVLVLTVYLLAGLPQIQRTTLRMVPRSRRARTGLLAEEMLRRVGGYMAGNLITSIIAGAGTTVFLLVVGVPYPLFLGLLVAVADLIPIVGAPAAGAVVALVALTVSVPVALLSIAFTAAFRLLEDYLVTPHIMRRTVEVPGVVTVVAVLVGGALLGIVGALLAIPVAAALQLLLQEVVHPAQDTR